MITYVEYGSPEFNLIRPRVDSCLIRLYNKTETDWTPSDIHGALSDRNAALFLAEDVGFFVIRVFGTVMDIWVGASFDGSAPMLREYFEELYDIGLSTGCDSLRFSSARAGWGKAAGALGFSPVSTTVTYEFRG